MMTHQAIQLSKAASSEPFPLQAQGLSVGYANRVLAENLHLKAQPGHFVGIIGPNGAGKSTLLRTLGGLQLPLKGSVLAQGQLLAKQHPQAIAKAVAMVMTGRAHVPHLSVYDLVGMGRYPHTAWHASLQKIDIQVIEEALLACHAQNLAERMANSLSDGEFQRVMIARAIAQQTPCLLLDEPTAHLDMPSRFSIFKLLVSLAQTRQQAILMTTHELDLAIQYCHELWVLLPNGRCAQGNPDELLRAGIVHEAFPDLPADFLRL